MKTHIPENITRVFERLEKDGNQNHLPGLIACMALDF
jgi:hypothetical protein